MKEIATLVHAVKIQMLTSFVLNLAVSRSRLLIFYGQIYLFVQKTKKMRFFQKAKIRANIFHKNIFENKLRHF
jgi:hypothetical protein